MAAPPQLYDTFPKVNQWNQAANLEVSIDDSVDWEGACQPEKSHSWGEL